MGVAVAEGGVRPGVWEGRRAREGGGGSVGGRGLFGARINTVIESCLTGSEGRGGEGGMQSEREASSQ